MTPPDIGWIMLNRYLSRCRFTESAAAPKIPIYHYAQFKNK